METTFLLNQHRQFFGHSWFPARKQVTKKTSKAAKTPVMSLEETISVIRKEERTLIGQELHDNVNQLLMSAKLFIEMMNAGQKEKMMKDRSIEYILMAIGEIRKISMELVKSDAGCIQLANSLEKMIYDIHLTTPMNVELQFDAKAEGLGYTKKIALFRIVQEQLRNIITHSSASNVLIRIEVKNRKVLLEIKDNGVGFNASKQIRGLGLNNIYERARSLNGSVDLLTAEGKGCSISVLIPAA